MKMLELIPTNGRKSFYGKATMLDTPEKATLYSYNTEIAVFDKATNSIEITYKEKMSTTTSSHFKAFKAYFGA